MKKGKLILWQAITCAIPILYLLAIWKNLPETVPIHYNAQFIADGFGTKSDVLRIILFVQVIAIGSSLLAINLNKLDPKLRYESANKLINKISWTIIIFITLISVLIVYQTSNYTGTDRGGFQGKYLLVLIALLFTVLGNFMNNIKPNYFVGIRTPWTLEDEDNWRRTHHLASRIWFFGGLIMIVLILLLPQSAAHYIFIGGLIPLCVIPVGYSYNIFRQKKKHMP